MVDGSVVLGTVKNMIESGLDDAIIKETLKDIGLNDSEISEVLRQAHSAQEIPSAKPKQQAQSQAAVPEQGTERPRPLVFPEESEALDTASVHNAISGLGDRIDALHSKIDNSSALGSSQPQAFDDSQIKSRIDSIAVDVKELKAGTNALVDLMKKILETDREVLLRLEGKRK